MFTVHEGEIILKEKYGSSLQERFYVKPPEQRNIALQENDKLSDVAHWLTRIFLPQGYPDSVSKDYIAYQIWDTAQAFCSTITGTLATQEVLRGVGVGDTTATPLAATVTWVIKDGCGHLGKIVFAYTHGTQLDAYSKKWRLYADVLNDAAMCIEMALPLFKNSTTFVLCISTVMKAIVGVAGGATRAAMTQHHAVRGNLADVSAKDSAQETAVNLVSSFTALAIITLFGNSLFIFVLMMALHIMFNYLAVRAVCLRTLNEPRFLQLIDRYIKQEVISSPCDINQSEPVVFYLLGPNLLDLKMTGFRIHLGCSMKKVMGESMAASQLTNIIEIYKEKKYIIFPNAHNKNTHVLIKEDAAIDDVLCAYFHAVLLSIITTALNDDSFVALQLVDEGRPFALMCRTLQEAEWSRQDTEGRVSEVHEPSHELHRFVAEIVANEWRRILPALKYTGWDLNKHLLIVDEWRILSKDILSCPISFDKLPESQSIIDIVNPTSKIAHFNIAKTPTTDETSDGKPYTIEPETRVKGSFSNLQTLKDEVNKIDEEKAHIPETNIDSEVKDIPKLEEGPAKREHVSDTHVAKVTSDTHLHVSKVTSDTDVSNLKPDLAQKKQD